MGQPRSSSDMITATSRGRLLLSTSCCSGELNGRNFCVPRSRFTRPRCNEARQALWRVAMSGETLSGVRNGTLLLGGAAAGALAVLLWQRRSEERFPYAGEQPNKNWALGDKQPIPYKGEHKLLIPKELASCYPLIISTMVPRPIALVSSLSASGVGESPFGLIHVHRSYFRRALARSSFRLALLGCCQVSTFFLFRECGALQLLRSCCSRPDDSRCLLLPKAQWGYEGRNRISTRTFSMAGECVAL
jgi:hypothetical protein